jgi:hypothetical protein
MPPDGYALLMINPSYVVNPTLYGKGPYEFEKDFDLVSLAVLEEGSGISRDNRFTARGLAHTSGTTTQYTIQ